MQAHSVWASFGYAFVGLWYAVRTQRNVRIQFVIAALVAILAAWLHVPLRDGVLLALVIGLVIAGELANTALETVVNLVSPEHHELARIAKDVSAAAVLCLSLTAAVVGACVLLPALLERTWG